MYLRNKEIFQLAWYIEHRIEFLENRLEDVRGKLVASDELLELDTLRIFLEHKGGISELRKIQLKLEELRDI
jgi:hypothetical protein